MNKNIYWTPIYVFPSAQYHDVAAKEKANLHIIGKPNGSFVDLIIGCTAVQNNMIMVTRNIKHFENIRNICLENLCVDYV